MYCVYLLLSSLILSSGGSPEFCKEPEREVIEPVSFLDGDYIIGALFSIGRSYTLLNGTDTQTDTRHCSYEEVDIYRAQKAAVFREVMMEERARLRSSHGIDLGYLIYDTCYSSHVAAQVSAELAYNPKVVGVLGVDHRDAVKLSSHLLSSFRVPSINYMYVDSNLLDPAQFPSLISMAVKANDEVQIIEKFLQRYGFRYYDIWSHPLSERQAHLLFSPMNKFAGPDGDTMSCGRLQALSSAYKDDAVVEQFVDEFYSKTNTSKAAVQIFLENSITQTTKLLSEMIERDPTDTVYVIGASIGRMRYLQNNLSGVFKEHDMEDVNLFAVMDLLLNTKIQRFSEDFFMDWFSAHDKLDELILKGLPKSGCTSDSTKPTCTVTSWSSYIIAATKILTQSLESVLLNPSEGSKSNKCLFELRDSILKEILQVHEGKSYDITLGPQQHVKALMRDRVIRFPIKLVQYHVSTGTMEVLGEGYTENFTISSSHDTDQRLQEFQKSCSEDCQPGEFRILGDMLGENRLPCCWKCHKCQPHHFSTRVNEIICSPCQQRETHSPDQSSCVEVKLIYIMSNTMIMLGLLALAGIGVCMCVVVGLAVWKNESRPVIKASEPSYLYNLVAGLMLGFMASVVPLLRPTQASCTTEYILGSSFLLYVSSNLLWKCIKIHSIFAASRNFKRPKLEILIKKTGHVFLSLVSFTFILVFICLDIFVAGSGWHFVQFQASNHTPVYPMCMFQNLEDPSAIITLIPVTLPGLYFVITLIYVFRMRHFPHNFNESLNILTATAIVMFCSIMFLSGYSMSPPETRAMLRSITLLVTNLSFLLCIFIPRIVILMKKADVDKERLEIQEELKDYNTRETKSDYDRASKSPGVNRLAAVAAVAGFKGTAKTVGHRAQETVAHRAQGHHGEESLINKKNEDNFLGVKHITNDLL